MGNLEWEDIALGKMCIQIVYLFIFFFFFSFFSVETYVVALIRSACLAMALLVSMTIYALPKHFFKYP